MKLTGLRVRTWAALETYVGGLGVLLGAMLTVLGRSWASPAHLGPPGGPWAPILGLLGLSWAAPGRSWRFLGASWRSGRLPGQA